MTDVFVSYARPTAATADRIADALRAAGLSVWQDKLLPTHRGYADEIADRLEEARAVVVLWSHDAVKSHWVRSEADRARIKGTLIQLRTDEALLPMPFDQLHCIDLVGWLGEISAPAWQRVLASIDGLLGPAPSTPAPAAPMARNTVIVPSIAVLPFKDLSASRDQDYFCDGIAEEILNALSSLRGLRVAASAATARSDLTGLAIARSLNVRSFLEGSVRLSGTRARIAVRLIDTSEGFTLWTETFDRPLEDVFAVQDEIARAIVAALGITLGAGESTDFAAGGTAIPKAHDLYLRARQLVRKELESEARTAADLFREATCQDPSFALAYAGLADILAVIARWKLADWQSATSEAIAAAERAVALAPGLAEAHLALGASLRLRHDPAARAAFERALVLSPDNPSVHYRFARFLVLEGDKAGAIAHYEQAFALAPDDYRYVVLAMQEYQALGDADGEHSCLTRSAAAIEQHLALTPDDVRALGHGAGILALLGRSAESKRYIAKAAALRPDDYGNLGTLACAAMLDDDPDGALDLLERAVGTGRGDLEWIMADNDLKPLHGHPRFQALLDKLA